MFLRLFIDGYERQAWYLDDDTIFRENSDLTFERRIELHKKIIEEKAMKIRQDYYIDLACCAHWEIVLEVGSRANRFEPFELGQ